MFTQEAKAAFLTFAIHPAENPILSALDEALRASPDAPPSQAAGHLLEWLFANGILPEGCRADFLYTIDTMHTWLFLRDMNSPTQRRSRHPRERARRIRCIAFNFANDSQLDRPVCDILADPETRYHRREDLTAPRVPLALRYRLAAAIDRGEEPVIRRTEELLASCPDYAAAAGMRMLGNPAGSDERIISGESGASSFGCVARIMTEPALAHIRSTLGLDRTSRVLFFSTEGATDKENYRAVVWEGKIPCSETV